jgi:Zn finger protein HypA/HybF involved in hydrogenase expression
MEYQYKTSLMNGTLGKNGLKRFLTEEYGYKCAECGLSEWRNKPIVLELEHRDGNSENNEFENLCLICPNCHSQTDTYKGKNKGNGRHARRQRYAEGKSY